MSKTLYERLGGINGITKLVDDVVDLHMLNPVIAPRFTPYAEDLDKLAVIKNHTVNFFCMGSGGPQTYEGRDMPTTHKGMNISEQEYLAVIDDIMQALEKNDRGEEEKKDVLAILYSLKEGIIRT